ncbi:MAG: DUF6678 family protein [Chloroflexota bacterium]
MTGQDPRRKKLQALLGREGFSSYMNDTRWMRLIEELRSLGLPLRYRIKLLTDADASEWGMWFAQDPEPYIELEGFGPVLALEVEWLEIDATGPWKSSSPDWIPPDPIDYSVEIALLLEELRVPSSQDGTLFRVTGHLRRTEAAKST